MIVLPTSKFTYGLFMLSLSLAFAILFGYLSVLPYPGYSSVNASSVGTIIRIFTNITFLRTNTSVEVFFLPFLRAMAQSIISQQFNYTGVPPAYTVPTGVTSISVVANGAQGGGIFGGLRGRVAALLTVTPGQVLTIMVGGQNGFNGGGSGANTGGGATEIRVGGPSINDRVLVAGGAGSGGPAGWGDFGGSGGPV